MNTSKTTKRSNNCKCRKTIAAKRATAKRSTSRKTTTKPRAAGSSARVNWSNPFKKEDFTTVAFSLDGNGQPFLKGGTVIGLEGLAHFFRQDTKIALPKLVAGTDYAIHLFADGTLRATANFERAGAALGASRKIGGFHYAPGGNAKDQAGGDEVPAINPYSLWDLKFRPACPDPRGMALVQDRFWCDIYLCNTAPEKLGTSRYDAEIADGRSAPMIPVACGGDGVTRYQSFTRWEAAEVLMAAGKDLLSYDEFCAAAYGTTEGNAAGSDPERTILRAPFTSRCGVMLATGNMWVWGREFSHWPGESKVGWKNVTGGRGQLFLPHDYALVAALFGGNWGNGADAGSRASDWGSCPWYSNNGIGARGRCDHLRLA